MRKQAQAHTTSKGWTLGSGPGCHAPESVLLDQTSPCYPISDRGLREGSQGERSDLINSGGRKVNAGTQRQTLVQVGDGGCTLSTGHDRVMGSTVQSGAELITQQEGLDS